ncbi:hypothetical protein ACHWQZ_G015027 [Mnemiopsis leidyi]
MMNRSTNPYLLRPRRGLMTSSSYQPGYQPPTSNIQPPPLRQEPDVRSQTSASTPHLDIGASIEDATATLDGMLPMIDSMKPGDQFQISVCNVLRLLVGQLKEIKLGQAKLQKSTISSLGVVDENLIDISRSAVKSEQYHRRDTLTVTGVPKNANETDAELEKKVAESLSLSGETVKPADFSVIHRNGNQTRKDRRGEDADIVEYPVVSARDLNLFALDQDGRGRNLDLTCCFKVDIKFVPSFNLVAAIPLDR